MFHHWICGYHGQDETCSDLCVAWSNGSRVAVTFHSSCRNTKQITCEASFVYGEIWTILTLGDVGSHSATPEDQLQFWGQDFWSMPNMLTGHMI